MTYDLRTTNQGQQAQNIQSGFRQQVEYIRADKRLTEQGKRQAIAATYLEAKQQLGALKNDESTKRTNEIGSLRRLLFGTAGTADAQTAISYRDAQERVGRLALDESDKAAKLLDQAMLSGDDVLVKAVIQRALDAQWADVANMYIEKHPYYGQKLEELWNLEGDSSEGIDTVAFINSTVFHLDKPGEISGYFDDARIEAVANGE